jgi:hypothetical protein
MRIKVLASSVLFVLTIPAIAPSQAIPKSIWGKWRIVRELPTRTISCWGESDAKKIMGTEIEYSERAFRWNQITVNNPASHERIVTAEQFRDENSSASSNGSQIDFHQLGITAKETRQISIHHDPASISKATTEIPGDDILMKSADKIVLSVCDLYFEAQRVRERK